MTHSFLPSPNRHCKRVEAEARAARARHVVEGGGASCGVAERRDPRAAREPRRPAPPPAARRVGARRARARVLAERRGVGLRARARVRARLLARLGGRHRGAPLGYPIAFGAIALHSAIRHFHCFYYYATRGAELTLSIRLSLICSQFKFQYPKETLLQSKMYMYSYLNCSARRTQINTVSYTVQVYNTVNQ